MDRDISLASLKAGLAAMRATSTWPHGDEKSIFRYEMHTLPNRDRRPHRHVDAVRRMERGHLREPDRGGTARRGGDDGRYLDATQDVLQKHGGLCVNDETFVVTRRAEITMSTPAISERIAAFAARASLEITAADGALPATLVRAPAARTAVRRSQAEHEVADVAESRLRRRARGLSRLPAPRRATHRLAGRARYGAGRD